MGGHRSRHIRVIIDNLDSLEDFNVFFDPQAELAPNGDV